MEFSQLLQRHQAAVEQALHDVMDGPTARGLPLYRMMQYQLGWVDQDGSPELHGPPDRLYAALCLEAAQAGPDPQAAGPAAAAAELFYQSITVHEDMQMGNPGAESRASIWWVWGPAQAINVGDSLHALARLAVLSLQSKGLTPEQTLATLRALDVAALRFYEGQYLELTFQERIDITESQYLGLAEAKAGALLSGAMALGAAAAGADQATLEALRRCGERLGMAAQIQDDILQVWKTSDAQGASPKMLNKSKLFPVVYALEKAALAQKRALGEAYFKRIMEPDDAQRVRLVLEEVGASEYAEQKARAITQEALQELEAAGLAHEVKERWAQIAAFLVGG